MGLSPLIDSATSPDGYQLPEDGWYPLVPAGEFPVQDGERTLVQVLDAPAFAQILARFQAEIADRPAGLLVDYDHFSHDLDKPSRAAGWITDVAERDGGLSARIRWSGQGRIDVEGGAYRFLSPVFDGQDVEDLGAGRIRPLRLLNAGLTNDPNLKTLRPLSNRNRQQENTTVNEAIRKALGLPADASEEQAIEAIAALREAADKAKAAEEELGKLKQKELDNRVQEDLEEHSDKIADPEKARKALLTNRQAALDILSAIRTPSQSGHLPNRRTGRVPGSATGDLESGPEADRRAAAIRNRAAAIQQEQRVNYRTAFRLARAELAG
jgi:phage I-like protein